MTVKHHFSWCHSGISLSDFFLWFKQIQTHGSNRWQRADQPSITRPKVHINLLRDADKHINHATSTVSIHLTCKHRATAINSLSIITQAVVHSSQNTASTVSWRNLAFFDPADLNGVTLGERREEGVCARSRGGRGVLDVVTWRINLCIKSAQVAWHFGNQQLRDVSMQGASLQPHITDSSCSDAVAATQLIPRLTLLMSPPSCQTLQTPTVPKFLHSEGKTSPETCGGVGLGMLKNSKRFIAISVGGNYSLFAQKKSGFDGSGMHVATPHPHRWCLQGNSAAYGALHNTLISAPMLTSESY